MEHVPLVHKRVFERHPQLSLEDIQYAWKHRYYEGLRPESDNFPEYLWLGKDSKGRDIEMVGTIIEGGYLIYHANTPLSKRTQVEVKFSTRRRRR